jgi:hypothetical protein
VATPVPCGYHFLILNGKVEPDKYFMTLEGSIECGRDLDSDGAHCLGYNETSIGVCLVGDGPDSFVIDQFSSLKKLLQELCIKYSIPVENILGHGETESGKKEGKSCPNFSVADIRMWLKGKI